MKKLLFFLAIALLTENIHAQSWETVKIDSTVSIKLPKGFVKKEGDQKYSLSAVSPFGTILIFKEEDDTKTTPDIEKDKHLTEFYNSYLDNVRRSSNDAIITNERDSTLGALKVKDFTLQIDSGSGVLYRDFRILHANSATYTFEFLYQDIHKEYALAERTRFFNSIEVNEDLERRDQFTNDTFESEVPGQNRTAMIAGAAVVIVVLIVAGIWCSRRRKKR